MEPEPADTHEVQAVAEAPRRWRRYHFDVCVRLVQQTLQDRTEVLGRGTEVNEGGIAVEAPIDLNLGDQVEVEFSPTFSGIPVRLLTAVRSRVCHGYGLEFLARNESEQRLVERVGQLLRGATDFREFEPWPRTESAPGAGGSV